MRPYWAVIKDSFREALASRVLWILLILITLFLAFLAPLALRQETASEVERKEIRGSLLVRSLVDGGESDQTGPARAVWDRLPQPLRTDLKSAEFERMSESEQRRLIGRLRDELNRMLADRDLAKDAVWDTFFIGQEAKKLRERDPATLADAQVARLNRLLLSDAFPQAIVAPPETSLHLTWLGFKLGGDLPFQPEDTERMVGEVLGAISSLFVGTIGVFVAILVTASIIPHMFEPGAIDLLLSKPVSRSLLFLTKFLGGCAFILVNAVYFMVGLWLIAGVRFGVWSNELLLCIPIFLFLFAIYYSVSALAGVIWRNAVVSIVLTILFWLICWMVGTGKDVTETFFLNQRRLAVVAPAADGLIATNKAGTVYEWVPEENRWEEILQGTGGGPPTFGMFYPWIGPARDSSGDRLVAIDRAGRGFAGGGHLVTALRQEDWRPQRGVSVPPGTETLFLSEEGEILVAGVAGIHKFQGDAAVDQLPFKIFGFDLNRRNSPSAEFVSIGPESLEWRSPFAAAYSSGHMVVYQRGRLLRLERDAGGRFNIAAEADLQTQQPAVVALGGDTIIVALEDGRIRAYAAEDLIFDQEWTPFEQNPPRFATSSPDGRWFAVLFHDRRLWMYDAESGEPVDPDISGAGDISAVAFGPENDLYAADRFGRVIRYDPATFRVKQRYAPAGDLLEQSYRFFLKPLYTVFPKPGELDHLVSYLLTGKQTAVVGQDEENLQSERIVLNVWQPVWSSLAFLVIVLGLACLYVARKDF